MPENPTRPVFNVPNLFALRSDCCFGFIWCINVSQSLKLTDMTACKVRFPHDFLMSWKKRRSWNNAGHCHPLVTLFSKQYPYTSKIYKELAFPAPWANLRNTWWIHIDYGHASMYAGRKQVACTQRSRKGSLSSSFCRCGSRRCTVPRNATAKRVNCLCKVIFCFVQGFIQCPKWNGVSQVCSKHNFEEIPGWR